LISNGTTPYLTLTVDWASINGLVQTGITFQGDGTNIQSSIINLTFKSSIV
jgi:hypothetical protein